LRIGRDPARDSDPFFGTRARLSEFASRFIVAIEEGDRSRSQRRSRSAAVICHSFVVKSARLRRSISAYFALVRKRRLPYGVPVAPPPERGGDLTVVEP
jgi:hypothetical protein